MINLKIGLQLSLISAQNQKKTNLLSHPPLLSLV
jgi:hypothetical protein